jgi:hypothetical protein
MNVVRDRGPGGVGWVLSRWAFRSQPDSSRMNGDIASIRVFRRDEAPTLVASGSWWLKGPLATDVASDAKRYGAGVFSNCTWRGGYERY